MEAHFNITHTLTPEQHKLYYRLLYNRILKKERTFSLIATAVLLALTPYIFADDSRNALILASVLFLNFVNSAFLTQQLAFAHRLIGRKRYEISPVQYSLNEDAVCIAFSAPKCPPVSLPYDKVLFCMESDDALFLLCRVESAVLVLPKDALTPNMLDKLRIFLTEKTGKDFESFV